MHNLIIKIIITITVVGKYNPEIYHYYFIHYKHARQQKANHRLS